MKKLAILSAAALIGLGGIASTDAEAGHRRGHGGGAIAAGVIGGLAAGALLGAAASNAYAAPAYGYGYAPTTRVVQSYGYAPEVYEEAYVPRRAYRTTRVVRSYEAPACRTTRVVRSYDRGYAPTGYWGGPGVNFGFGGGFFDW